MSISGGIHTRNTHGAHFEGKLVPVPLVAHHGTEQQTFVNWLSAGQVVLESVGRDSFVPAGTWVLESAERGLLLLAGT